MKHLYKHVKSFVLAGFLLSVSCLEAQVDVSSGGGPVTTYSTVSSAFTAINAGTHTGMIRIDITGNTTEPSTPTALAASGQGSASYSSVRLRPTVTATISGAPSGGRSVIELNGADSVIIDGDIVGGTVNRDLTIMCTTSSTTNYVAAIRLIGATSGGLGCRNDAIRNCVVIGSVNSTSTTGYQIAGIIAGGGTGTSMSSLTSTGANFDRLSITNNTVKRCYYGIIVMGGTSASTADTVKILNNDVGSTNATEYNVFKGIYIGNCPAASISYNHVYNMFSPLGTNIAGIEIAGSSVTAGDSIIGNTINSIAMPSTGGWGSYGINFIVGNNHIVANNVIYDITTTNYSNTSTTYNAFGIRLTAGTGYKIYYNSVNIFGNYTYTGWSTAASAALLLTSTAVTGEIRNNIFNNKMTTTASTRNFMALWFPSGYNFANMVMDNNAYTVLNDNDHYVGAIGTISAFYSLLPAWRAVSSVGNVNNDGFSVPSSYKAVAPFTSDINLQIPANTVSPMESGAIVVNALGLPNKDVLLNLRPKAGVNANALPDMGAYEFDGVPLSNDIGVVGILKPVAGKCYTANDSIRVRIKNFTGTPIVFSSNISAVQVNVAGPNPATYTLVLNSGTLGAYATMDTLVTTNYNMSALGTYSFTAFTILNADSIKANDTTKLTRVYQVGNFTPSTKLLCGGAGVTLTLNNNSSNSIQWQQWSGSSFVNSTAPGNTSNPFTPTAPLTTIYRALMCGFPSNQDTVHVELPQKPVAYDTIRCGAGNITVRTTGNPLLFWYNVPTGGTPVGAGTTYTTFVSQTDTFYVESISGGNTFYSPAETTTMSTLSSNASNVGYGLSFNVNTAFMLNTVDIYPTAAGNFRFEIRSGTTTVFTSPLYAITASQVNTTVTVPCGYYFVPGTNYSIRSATGNTAALKYNYNFPTNFYPRVYDAITVVNSLGSTGRWEYFYNWNISTGCRSVRDSAIVTVTPAPVLSINASTTGTVCVTTPVTLSALSSSPAYSYTWSPVTNLGNTTGPQVNSYPGSTITYTVTGVEAGTNCQNTATVTVHGVQGPNIYLSTSLDTVCSGNNVLLNVSTTPNLCTTVTNTVCSSPTLSKVGTGTSSNASYSYPSPYAKFWYDAHTQYVYTKSELIAAGVQPGSFISSLSFTVAALNGVANMPNYTIKMKCVQDSVVSAFDVNGLSTVFTSASLSPVAGTNTHVFQQPYFWDGSSNLLVDLCFGNTPWSNNASVEYTTTGYTSCIYAYLTTSSGSSCGGTTSSGTSNARANASFGWCAPPSSAFSYTWGPTALVANPTNASTLAHPAATTYFTAKGTSPTSTCPSYDSIRVVVNPLPNLHLGNDTLVCTTGPLVYKLNAGTGSSYLWNTGVTTNTLNVIVSGTYYVHAVTSLGCSKDDTINVVLSHQPVVILGADTGYCIGSPINLNAGNPGMIYSWSPGGQTTQMIPVSTPGTYMISVSTPQGCVDKDTINVVSKTVPSVNFVLTGVTNFCNNDAGRTFTEGTPTGGSYIGAGMNGSFFSPQLAGIGGKTIIYTYTAPNGCSAHAIDTVWVQNCTGIEELFAENGVALYPNPNNGHFVIAIDALKETKVSIELLSVDGRLVYSDSFTTNQGLVEKQIDLDNLANGVYYFRLIHEVGVYTTKMVKQE